MPNQQLTPPATSTEVTGNNRMFTTAWTRWLVSLYNFVLGIANGSIEQQTRVLATYTAVATDDILLAYDTLTITLPLTTFAGFVGKRLTVVLMVSSKTVTIAPTSPQTINGSATATISTQWGVLRLKALATGGWVAL